MLRLRSRRTPSPFRGSRLSKPLQVAIAVLLVSALLFWVTDPHEIWLTLNRLDVRWALVAVLIITADRLLMTYKWLGLLAARGHTLSVFEGTALYCNAMLWGMALPTTVGADTVRTLSLRKRGVPLPDAISSILVERGIGFLSAMAMALVALLALRHWLPGYATFWPWFLAGGLFFSAAILLFVLSFSPRAFDMLEQIVPSRWHGSSVMRKLKSLHEAYRSLRTGPGVLLRFTAMTFLQQLIPIPLNWAVARALGIDIPLIVLLGVLPLTLLVSRLPVTVEGIGVFEGAFVALLSQAGVHPAQAVAIALTSRALFIVTLLPWWLMHGIRSGWLRPRIL